MKNQLNKSIIPQGFVAQPSKVAKVPVANIAATHDDIARRAYEIYVKRGRLHNRCEQDWYQAEQELKSLCTVKKLLQK